MDRQCRLHSYFQFSIYCLCFILYKYWGLEWPMVRSISLRKKALPGMMTLQAKFNNPTNDCNSLNVTLRFRLKVNNKFDIFWILSDGNQANIAVESISIPYIVNTLVGSCVLSCFIGTPICLHIFKNTFKV